MSYLKTAGILSAGGSFLANRIMRDLSKGNSLLLRFFIETIIPYKNGYNGHNRNMLFGHVYGDEKIPNWTFNKNDFLAMGVGTVAPLLISGYIKTSLRDLDKFHAYTSIAVSAAMTTYLILMREEPKNDDTKNNKPKDDDKPLVPVPKPSAISQLSEYEKEFLKNLKMLNPDDLDDIEKMQYNYLKNIHDTTTDKKQLFQIKFELDDLYRNHYKRELDFYKRESLAQINHLFKNNIFKNNYYEQKINGLFYNHSISSSNDIKEATRIGQKQASMLSDMCKKMVHLKSSMKSYETAFTHKNIELLLKKNDECKKIITEIYDTAFKNQTDSEAVNNIFKEIYNYIIPEYVQRLKRDREYRAWARAECKRKQQPNTGNTAQYGSQQPHYPNRNIPKAVRKDIPIESLEHKAVEIVNKYLKDNAKPLNVILQEILPHETSSSAEAYDKKQKTARNAIMRLIHNDKISKLNIPASEKPVMENALKVFSQMINRLNNINYHFQKRKD